MRNNSVVKGFWFSLTENDEEYVAFITAAALHTHFQATGPDKRQLAHAYRKHRKLIDAMAMDRLHNHAPRPIKLDVTDFTSAGVLLSASYQTASRATT